VDGFLMTYDVPIGQLDFHRQSYKVPLKSEIKDQISLMGDNILVASRFEGRKERQ